MRAIIPVCLAVVLALAGCRSGGTDGVPSAGAATAPAPAPAAAAPHAVVRVSGPYVHEELAIWLLHGPDRMDTSGMLTLGEALAAKQAVVHETGDVNRLAIEATGERAVFLQAGDIVKGGRQDRTIAVDLVVRRADGKVPLDAFCVEAGRWSRRGGEDAAAFAGSGYAVSGNAMKAAIREQGSSGGQAFQVFGQEVMAGGQAQQQQAVALEDRQERLQMPDAGQAQAQQQAAQTALRERMGGQSAVWEAVAAQQAELGENVAFDAQQLASASSFQLTLEDPTVKAAVAGHEAALHDLVAAHPDAIGFAYAFRGSLDGAEVYPSHDLLLRLWPKMLNSAAVEAVARRDDPAATLPDSEAVAGWIRALDAAPAAERELQGGYRQRTRAKERERLYETAAPAQADVFLHRTYLK